MSVRSRAGFTLPKALGPLNSRFVSIDFHLKQQNDLRVYAAEDNGAPSIKFVWKDFRKKI